MITTRSTFSPFHVLPAILLSGCASWFLHGAKMADHDYAASSPAGYRISGCTDLATGAPVAPVSATYHLINEAGGDSGLFERSANGKGALIQNRWHADDGDHYFTWVKQTGWEYIVPKDKPPTRLVYVGVSELENSDGSVRPTTPPAARCEMVALAGAGE